MIPSSSAIRVRFPAQVQNLTQGVCKLTELSTHFVSGFACNVTGLDLLITSPFGTAGSYKNGSGPLTFTFNQTGLVSAAGYPFNLSSYQVQTLSLSTTGQYLIDISQNANSSVGNNTWGTNSTVPPANNTNNGTTNSTNPPPMNGTNSTSGNNTLPPANGTNGSTGNNTFPPLNGTNTSTGNNTPPTNSTN